MPARALERFDDDAGHFIGTKVCKTFSMTARLSSVNCWFSESDRDVSMNGKGTLRFPVMKPWKSRVMTGSLVSCVMFSAKIVRPWNA
jgi:hypothetical protein